MKQSKTKITLTGPNGQTKAMLISIDGRFVTLRVGEDYFRFRRATGEPAGSQTLTKNPYRIDLSELDRLTGAEVLP